MRRFSKVRTFGLVALLGLAVAGADALGLAGPESSGVPGNTTAPAARLRVGTYDNRAIAVAFAPSKFMREWYRAARRELEEAKAAGDTEKVKELEQQGEWEQKKLHFQGFGHAPVGDLLAHVKDRLPEVAKKADVQLIAWEYDLVAEGVEVVDVTDLLVELFEPSEKTLRRVKEIRELQPMPLEELDRMNHNH